MDCRKFQKNLEDYLEGGLDFAGRFGMERHAQQCISCGKVLAGAQQLAQMSLKLKKVQAPSNFESSVLNEIGVRKLRSPFSGIRRYWIYGFEWPSWRKLALAASSIAVLGFAIFSPSKQAVLNHGSTTLPATGESAQVEEYEYPVTNPDPAELNTAAAVEAFKAPDTTQPAKLMEEELLKNLQTEDLEYVEYFLAGPDSRPIQIQLPKKIRMQYGQASEEYFIRNVSH